MKRMRMRHELDDKPRVEAREAREYAARKRKRTRFPNRSFKPREPRRLA